MGPGPRTDQERAHEPADHVHVRQFDLNLPDHDGRHDAGAPSQGHLLHPVHVQGGGVGRTGARPEARLDSGQPGQSGAGAVQVPQHGAATVARVRLAGLRRAAIAAGVLGRRNGFLRDVRLVPDAYLCGTNGVRGERVDGRGAAVDRLRNKFDLITPLKDEFATDLSEDATDL